MKKDFLLEIGTEEIPASYLEDGIKSLERALAGCLKDNLIHFGSVKRFYTPRRLAILIKALALSGEDRVTLLTGPPKDVALKNGKPTPQLLGFAKAHNIHPDDVRIIKKGKREVVALQKREKGCSTLTILKNSLPSIIEGTEFPRTMRWEPSGVRFARPIRWIVSLLGRKVVKFQIAGVVSDRNSYARRGEKIITIEEPADYERLLLAGLIIANPHKRREKIESLIKMEAEENGLSPIKDEELLIEVANMVESPIAIIGRFDPSYLSLPDDVIRAALKGHQRYFWTEQSLKGTNYFISIADNPDGDLELIKRGNEKVLKARLEDARFYLKEDMKLPLDKRLDGLKEMVYATGLGSLYDKTRRIVELSETLVGTWIDIDKVDIEALRRAALLAKTDLTTNMIKDGKEFTKLEGAIGAEYARRQGEDKKTQDAIREHYLPKFADDRLPETMEGTVLALADKVDSLVGGYIVSGIPSSSKDPRGMRRDANGIVRILLEKSISISLPVLINKSFSLYKRGYCDEVLGFIISRCRQYLLDKGVPYNIVMSVPDVQDILLMNQIVNSIVKAGDIQEMVMVTKRINNILRGVETGDVAEEELIEVEEKELFREAKETETKLERAIKEERFGDALSFLREIVPCINRLFDKILIMAPDKDIKRNRLALLNYVYSLFNKIADFKSYGVK
ncbi:glycine--tRNA ligase subunit beta [candidate division WOR-3 bacterium]|nr:glycine--tRNA ligase subunit beta [candidate division WOR-3 bacterium]